MRKYFFIIFAAVFFVLSPKISQAAANIQVDVPAGPLFDVQNAAPGMEATADITVENTGDVAGNFPYTINLTNVTKNLSQQLFFKVRSESTCIFGCNNEYPLSVINGVSQTINNIPPDSLPHIYTFVLYFNKDANNDFQSAQVNFDATLGTPVPTTHSARRNGGGGGGGGNGGNGGGATPVAGVIGGAVAGAPGGIVGGAETGAIGEQPGQVQGEETAPGIVEGDQISTCQSWPKWVWVLMLIAYFSAFLWRTFENIKTQIDKRDIRWKWQAVLAAAAFLIWYFFDKCREFWWFVILAMIGGAIIYLLYLYLFRKNIQKKNEEIHSGFD